MAHWHRIHAIILALVCSLWASPLFAQEAAVANDKKGYSLAYALTGLCVVLGVLIVCRPLRTRADKIERPVTEE